ncbi:hypothetical protein EDC94DRAFT_646413 [Helicostylum pulchrum]|nr:hypothetical protein EDC94DRAFT_646413 [Helicostylum pulchrum]
MNSMRYLSWFYLLYFCFQGDSVTVIAGPNEKIEAKNFNTQPIISFTTVQHDALSTNIRNESLFERLIKKFMSISAVKKRNTLIRLHNLEYVDHGIESKPLFKPNRWFHAQCMNTNRSKKEINEGPKLITPLPVNDLKLNHSC